MAQQRDYKFLRWQNCRPLEQNWCSVKHERIKKIATTYDQNVKRTVYLHILIVMAFAEGTNYARKRLWAHHKVFGMDNPPDSTKQDEFQKMLDGLLNGTIRLPHQFSHMTWGGGFGPMEAAQKVNEHVETLMQTQLISMWTTFETMAGDLWEAAIDTAPATLANKAHSLNWAEVKAVTKNTFDIRGKIGALLRLGQKFDSIKGIREAYEELFPKVVDGHDSSSGEFGSILEDHSGNHLRQQRAAVELSPIVLG